MGTDSTSRATKRITALFERVIAWKLSVRILCAIAAISFAACTFSQQVVHHSFGFDAREDSPDIEVLDYQYGSSGLPGTENADAFRRENIAPQRSNTGGPMPRGDKLYVKWRIRGTGKIVEETADLQQSLPADITGHRIVFLVRGERLNVYLIPPEGRKRGPNTPTDGPRLYRHLNVVLIHPTNMLNRRAP